MGFMLVDEMESETSQTSRDAFGLAAATTAASPVRSSTEVDDDSFHVDCLDGSLETSEQTKAMDADFYRCLRSGQIDALKHMLEDDVENSKLGQLTPQHNTPLHILARRHGLDQLIELILHRRPHLLNRQNLNGDIPLHLAAGAGHLAAVETIMGFAGEADWGNVCEMRNRDGDTALHVAVRHKHTRVAIFLITAHPTASFCLNGRGESPLFVAAELGELELVKAILEKSTQGVNDQQMQSGFDDKGKSVIRAAISGGNSGVLKEILEKHEFLINSTITIPNKGKIYPLSYAALKGNIQMVRYILDKFPDCTYKRDPTKTFPIHVAAGAGHKLVIEEFLRRHPDSRELLTSVGHNILHTASFRGKHDVVIYVLSQPDFDELINAGDNDGNTPLHHAVAAKYPKVVDALTWDKRVRLDLVNNDGRTPMDLAFKYDNPVPSFKQQLAWLALRYAGAPRRNFQQANISKTTSEQATIDRYKGQVNTLSVVATLVTTISFAAAFTVPGGNRGSDPNMGMANFLKRRIFYLFVISNSIALYASVLNVLVLIFAMLGDVKLLQVSLKVAVPLLATSLTTMSISFMSAAYLVLSSLRWLGIVVWVLGSLFLLVVLALFLVLYPPRSVKNRFTRYLAYLPFKAMLYICDRK